jgi:bacterioferritin-associated ferredoxin
MAGPTTGKDRDGSLLLADDEVVCGCTNLRLQQIQAMLSANPRMSFDELLSSTGAGKSCTACLLDLEYHFVTLPRTSRPAVVLPRVEQVERLSLKRRLYRLLDRLSPLTPMPLTEWMPVLTGEGIEQWVWVANHSLLYEGEERPPDFDVDVTVRDAEGQVRHHGTHGIPLGSALHLNVSRFLPPSEPEQGGQRLGIGSVTIRRRARRPGFRGTIRPQIEIISPAGSCAVHSQAPGGLPEQWFTGLYRPDADRLFLSFVNASAKALPVELAYPFEPDDQAAEALLVQRLVVPPHGARLHEITLPSPYAARFLNRLFSVRWRSSGISKVHVLCATPNLDRFSVDHL